MANVKITQLPLATTPLTGTEVFPLVQGTTTKQVAITGLFTSPVMTNPTLGTVGQADLINATGLPISTGVAGLGTGIATFLGTPSSANLRTAVTDETGSGSLVFANAPVLVAPDLGTPSVLVATNATGTAVGLTAGSAITNANLTGAVTSVGNATSLGSFTSAQLRTALTDETGSGVNVFATSPTITAPILNQINDTNNAQILGLSPTTSAVDYLVVKNGIGVGVPLHFYADGASANIGLHIQPKGTGLVTISDGTDFNKGIRFRSSSSAASAITLLDAVSTAGRVVTLPDATTTLVGRDTTDTLTNKTIAFSSNTFTGALAIANGGTGQATANAALNALLPSQTGNASKYLQTNGTDSSWDAISLSTADITGVLPTANGGTNLTSFTSGGVVYASSSSALTTGSALTFNGTVLTLGTSTALPITGSKFSIGNDANSALRLAISNQNAGASALVGIDFEPAGGGWKIDVPSDTSGFVPPMYFKAGASTNVTFAYGGNVGIGTTSPAYKLDISGTNPRIRLNETTGYVLTSYLNTGGSFDVGRDNSAGLISGAAYAGFLNVGGAYPLIFNMNTVERMRLDSAGNLGLGVTPSAGNVTTNLQIKNIQLSALTQNLYLSSNANYNGAWTYISTDFAAQYRQASSQHQWFTAPSGTAGNAITFTQAMTLDASGNLLVGATSGTHKFIVEQGTKATTAAVITSARFTTTDSGSTFGLFFRQKTDATAANRYAGITSFDNGVGPAPLVLQDLGSNVLIGTTTNNTSGGVLQISNGITFPATQSASSDANTLDDYEEGTWTPTYTSNGTASTFSYGLQIGYYTKIGNRVLCTMRLYTNTTGNTLGTGDISISGLPFAGQAGNQTTMISIYNLNGNWVTTAPSLANIPASTAAASLFGYTALNTNPVAITTANMSATDVNQTWSTFQYLVA